MAKLVRRIVTGHNKAGKSVILMDGPAPNAVSPPTVPQLVNTVLWITDDSPASNRGDEDTSPKGRMLGIEPPSRGSVFRVVDFPPDKVFEGIDARKMMEEVGGGHALDKGKARHSLFHKTNTVDYAIVLEDEIWAMLDEGEALMRPGDVLIQRGTNHSSPIGSRRFRDQDHLVASFDFALVKIARLSASQRMFSTVPGAWGFPSTQDASGSRP